MSRSLPASRILARATLAAVTLLAVVLAAELGLRWLRPVAFRAPAGPASAVDSLYRASALPGLAYELRPDIEASSHGVPVLVNAHGLRDVPRSVEPSSDVFRIAALGDSFTFGQGVPGERTWPAVLERMLGEIGGRSVEVLNFGVPGYSSRDEAALLEHRVLAFDPDLVIVGYTLNDPDADPAQGSLHAAYSSPRWWQHSHLLRLLAQVLHERDVRRLGAGNHLAWLHRDPTTWGTVELAFERMRVVSSPRELPIVIAIFPTTPGGEWAGYVFEPAHWQVARAASEAGFSFVDLLDGFRRHEPSRLRVAPDDSHPNALGHWEAARTLRDWLVEHVAALGPP
jgi:lysophospholipase L1-like esterase